MTEMVTINAAREAQQIALLAQRPEAPPREQSQSSIQISEASVEPDTKRAASQAEAGGQGKSDQDLSKRRDRADLGLTGPSRPRVEIREFDLGRTPAEVVGTTDVVQRFDTNGDGRIDLIESKRANRARNTDNSTFSGLAINKQAPGFPLVEGVTDAEQQAALTQTAPKTATVSTAASDPAVRAERAALEPKFGPQAAGSEDAQLKKYADKAEASQGFVSGEQPVAQKYYGRGSEAVVGQFAAEQPQKYADKAAATEVGGSFEDGSGEVKYSDKVAQTEADFAGGEQNGQQKSMYERAQEVSAALSETDPNGSDATRKTYSDTAVYGPAAKTTVTVAVDGKPVTIQITA